MPLVKAIEARLPVSDVAQSAAFFVDTPGFEITTLWPQRKPEFAILSRDGLRLQLGRNQGQGSRANASSTLWLDVEDLSTLHANVTNQTSVEWGPEVYSYGRREFGFRDPDGNWVILSEATNDPPTSRAG